MDQKSDDTTLFTCSDVPEYGSFEDMGLNDIILRGIYSYGFEMPSRIQSKAIVPIINKRDVIGQAPSGSGKTGAFGIGILNRVDPEKKYLQGMILSPTRELAMQIHKVLTSLSMESGIRIDLTIGGQNDEFRGDTQILVGTIGRVLYNIQSAKVDVRNLEILVLDETDEMLSKGFYEDMSVLFDFIPKTVQLCVFSATFNPEVMDLVNRITIDPIRIIVQPEELKLEGIVQYKIDMRNERDKLETLLDIFPRIMSTQAIIYCNSTKKVEQLHNDLVKSNYDVVSITGNMHQMERNDIMNNFRRGKHRVLIATNILARGIDVQQVRLVVNYDLPSDSDVYLHRIGRSGRFGRKGTAINFVMRNDYTIVQRIQSKFKIQMVDLLDNFTFE